MITINFNTVINGIAVNAHYSEESINSLFIPLLRQMQKMAERKGGRIVVFLAAPPGAGKSTLCEFLCHLSKTVPGLTQVTVIGMDGFHRRQEYLLAHTTVRDGREIPMVDIKGAPETFDIAALEEKLKCVAAGEDCGWPVYDRLLHNPVEDAVTVTGNIVLLEGNYLLLDAPGWRELKHYADYSIRIIAEPKQLRGRLLDRKINSGFY